MKGYDIIRNDRDDGRGGVAFLVRNNIKYIPVALDLNQFPQRFQGIGIEIEGVFKFLIYIRLLTLN